MMISSQIDQLTRELRAIICKPIFGRTTSANKPVKYLDDIFTSQAMTNFDGQAFSCEDVDNRQSPELFAVTQFIMDEV
jgi:hypothetical protein